MLRRGGDSIYLEMLQYIMDLLQYRHVHAPQLKRYLIRNLDDTIDIFSSLSNVIINSFSVCSSRRNL